MLIQVYGPSYVPFLLLRSLLIESLHINNVFLLNFLPFICFGVKSSELPNIPYRNTELTNTKGKQSGKESLFGGYNRKITGPITKRMHVCDCTSETYKEALSGKLLNNI